MTQMDSVGRTALMMAAIRAAEAGQPDPLFEDPYAGIFVPEQLGAMVRGWQAQLPIFTAVIRARTRWFDDVLRSQIDGGTRQVVILGAGCCTRALRFARPGVTFFEVDRPSVLSFKAERLANAGNTYGAVAVGADYTAPGMIKALVAHGFKPTLPTFVLWEGNSYYLPPEKIIEVLRALGHALPEVRIAFDYFNCDVIAGRSRAPGMRVAISIVKGLGSPWLGGIDDVHALGAQVGLRVAGEQGFRPLVERLLPNCDLGPDSEAEYGLCIYAT